MTADVFRAGVAAAITVEPGDRVVAAWLKLATEHIPLAHHSSIAEHPGRYGSPCRAQPSGVSISCVDTAETISTSTDVIKFLSLAGTA
jgi:hypothetical protein